jgi:hypothetical protein
VSRFLFLSARVQQVTHLLAFLHPVGCLTREEISSARFNSTEIIHKFKDAAERSARGNRRKSKRKQKESNIQEGKCMSSADFNQGNQAGL